MCRGWEIPNPINAMVPDKTKRCPFAVLKAAEAGASVASYPAGEGQEAPAYAGTDRYTAEQLSGMTIDSIRALAKEKGYVITKTVKAEIIVEFLEQQDA